MAIKRKFPLADCPTRTRPLDWVNIASDEGERAAPDWRSKSVSRVLPEKNEEWGALKTSCQLGYGVEVDWVIVILSLKPSWLIEYPFRIQELIQPVQQVF
jgi:hypothetical protein